MEQTVQKISLLLEELISCYRDLSQILLEEKESLASMDLEKVQEHSARKQRIIESIRTLDLARDVAVKEFGAVTLRSIVDWCSNRDLVLSEKLTTASQTLDVLVRRAHEQNEYNRDLVQQAIKHVTHLKNNILREAEPEKGTYTQKGTPSSSTAASSRLISKEA